MSVVGLPLLLALFQFVNDHEYPEPDERIRPRTVLYGILMAASTFTLWGLYFVSACVLQSSLGGEQLSTLLFVFLWVLLAIIFVILLIQLEQMVGEDLRYTLRAYLLAFFCFLIALYHFVQGNLFFGVLFAGATVLTGGLGLLDHRMGLEEAGDRTAAAWIDWRERRASEDEESDGE